MSARCEEVILAEEQRGAGVRGDPMRLILCVYRKDGTLLAERDSEAPAYCAGWASQVPGGWALAEGSRLRIVFEGMSTDRLANYSREQLIEALVQVGAPWDKVNALRKAVAELLADLGEGPEAGHPWLDRVAKVKAADREVSAAAAS